MHKSLVAENDSEPKNTGEATVNELVPKLLTALKKEMPNVSRAAPLEHMLEEYQQRNEEDVFFGSSTLLHVVNDQGCGTYEVNVADVNGSLANISGSLARWLARRVSASELKLA